MNYIGTWVVTFTTLPPQIALQVQSGKDTNQGNAGIKTDFHPPYFAVKTAKLGVQVLILSCAI